MQNRSQPEIKTKVIKTDPNIDDSDQCYHVTQFETGEHDCELENTFQDDYYADIGGCNNEREFAGKYHLKFPFYLHDTYI